MSKINESIMGAYTGMISEGNEGVESQEAVIKESRSIKWSAEDLKIEWEGNSTMFNAECELEVSIHDDEVNVDITELNDLEFYQDSDDDAELVDIEKMNKDVRNHVESSITDDIYENHIEDIVNNIRKDMDDEAGSDAYDRMMDRPAPDGY
jgi:hypothetical protein